MFLLFFFTSTLAVIFTYAWCRRHLYRSERQFVADYDWLTDNSRSYSEVLKFLETALSFDDGDRTWAMAVRRAGELATEPSQITLLLENYRIWHHNWDLRAYLESRLQAVSSEGGSEAVCFGRAGA